MEKSFIDGICGKCPYHWAVIPQTGQPGFRGKESVAICTFMRALNLKPAEAKKYVMEATSAAEEPDAVKLEAFDKQGIPCSALTACPSPKQVKKYERIAAQFKAA